jgi:hypothetical protein
VYGLVDSQGLGGVASILVGSVFIHGISCGDKRRLTIGAELMAGHAVVLGIRPLNGIDLTLAPRVLQVLRLLARESGAVVILSILEPNFEVFHVFRARRAAIRFRKPSHRGPSADHTILWLSHALAPARESAPPRSRD